MYVKHGLIKQVAKVVGLSRQTIGGYVKEDALFAKRLDKLDYIKMNYLEFVLEAKKIVQEKHNQKMLKAHSKPRVL